MPDTPARIPAMISHCAAYLQARAHATPEISMNGHQAKIHLSTGGGVLKAVFGCRKRNWSLRSIEVRRAGQITTFTHGELAEAVAALLGHEPQAPGPLPVSGAWWPRADATLREQHTTVIRA
jgi:hypothetical protein